MSLKNSCKRITVTVESTCLFTLATAQFTYGVVQSVEFCISPEHKPLMPSNTDNYFVNLSRQGLRQSHIRCYNLASQSSQNVDKSFRGHSQYSASSCLSAHWRQGMLTLGQFGCSSILRPLRISQATAHRCNRSSDGFPASLATPDSDWNAPFSVLRKTQMH